MNRSTRLVAVGAVVALATLAAVPASAAGAPHRASAKLPTNACKLLTLAQVQQVLPSAAADAPVHDKAAKEESCVWRVSGSGDSVRISVRPFVGDASTAYALFGTTDPAEKVKGLGKASAFAQNASDYTVRAVLGKLALTVKFFLSNYDQANPSDVAQLKANATRLAKQVAKKL